MGKIISFLPYCESSSVGERISKIKKELSKDSLSERKLHLLEKEILGLTGSLSDQMKKEAELTSHLIFGFLSQQTELSYLVFDCHTRFVNKKVDTLTSKAHHLANELIEEEKILRKKVQQIKKLISKLYANEALSLENRLMINLAKDFLQAASDHRLPSFEASKNLRLHVQEINKGKDIKSLSELSLTLFEIAGYVYELDYKKALEVFISLPIHTQLDVEKLLENHSISIKLLKESPFSNDSKTQRYLMVQTLIGYSHELLEGQFNLMTFAEIDDLFGDLKSALKEGVI